MTTNTSAPPLWMSELMMWIGVAFLLIMGALCLILLIKIWKNEINLSTLLDEADGDASMSRFQLLVFTLVFAVGFFLYILKYMNLPDIPNSVLVLLGISASTYAAGKGIQFSRPEGVVKTGTDTAPPPPPATDGPQQPGS
jgi:hypothetical protein